MKRFEFVEGSSSKFWEIAVSGKTVKTRWGRIGADGQRKEAELASPALAKLAAEKQIREKLAKGYAEVRAKKVESTKAGPTSTKSKAIAAKPVAAKAKQANASARSARAVARGFAPAPTVVPIPSVLRALVEMTTRTKHQLEDVREVIGADLDIRTLAQVVEHPDLGDECAHELVYGRWIPFEVIPFAWQGGDGLHYGHLVLAEELGATDWPAVSFAPSDESVRWLGDDTRQGLANLIATTGKFAAIDAKENDEEPEDVRWAARLRTRTAQELSLPAGRAQLRGARSKRVAKPEVPKGYRYVTAKNNVGILAPTKYFHPQLDAKAVAFEDLEDRAKQLLRDARPASALELMRIQRLSGDDEAEMAACEQMVRIYEAMGRPIMARRVEQHIRLTRAK